MKLGDLFIKLGLQKGEFDKGIDDAKRKTSAFGSAMGKIGGMIAGVFAVDKILQFGKEVFQIATQAEGVVTAFGKIGSAGDLDNLRISVKGTVSDLELMKRSVMASNFGIPVQQLGKLFEFASKRAQDTGQSVDYLVDSIVMGIGRKSPLILDNLGISAIQLREKLGDVSMEAATVSDITRAVGMIAEESLTKTGRLADNLGTKVQSLAANWQNLKMTISSIFSDSDMIKKDLDDWSKVIKIWQSKELSGWEKFLASFSEVQMNKVFDKMEILKGLEQRESTDGGILDKKAPPPKQDSIVKTAVEQLAAIKKVNDELEAQRILRQEFKGEKVGSIPMLGGPKQLPSKPVALDLVDPTSSIKANQARYEAAMKEYQDAIQAKNDELGSIIASGIGNAINSLSEGLGKLASDAILGNEMDNFGNIILKIVGSFMQTLGSAIIAIGTGMLTIDLGLKTFDPGLIIAGGAALVGAGALISGLAAGGVKGSKSATPAASGYSNYSQSSGTAALSGNVIFELEGTKLRGALNNTDRRNQLIR